MPDFNVNIEIDDLNVQPSANALDVSWYEHNTTTLHEMRRMGGRLFLHQRSLSGFVLPDAFPEVIRLMYGV